MSDLELRKWKTKVGKQGVCSLYLFEITKVRYFFIRGGGGWAGTSEGRVISKIFRKLEGGGRSFGAEVRGRVTDSL